MNLFLPCFFYISAYRTVIEIVPPPKLVAVESVPKYKEPLVVGAQASSPVIAVEFPVGECFLSREAV